MLNDAVTPLPLHKVFLNWKPSSVSNSCQMCRLQDVFLIWAQSRHTTIKNTSCILHAFGNCSEYRWKMYWCKLKTTQYTAARNIHLHIKSKTVWYTTWNFYFRWEQSFQWKVWNFCSHGTNILGVQKHNRL